MNNNNKATESQKKLLIVLLMAVVFFAAYRFGYQPLTEETEQLQEENTALQREIEDLKNKAKNQALYEAETDAIHVQIGEILEKFGPGVTPEKSILFFIHLAQAAQVQIPTISFGEPMLVYTTSSLANEEGAPYSQYTATYNVSYSTTYEGLKTLIAFVNQCPEKMNLNTLTAAYNSETDSLSGNFSVDWYMLTGTGKQYGFEDMEMIDIGNENIFRSGSGAGDGEGLDFDFDYSFLNVSGSLGNAGTIGDGDAQDGADTDGSEVDGSGEDGNGADDAQDGSGEGENEDGNSGDDVQDGGSGEGEDEEGNGGDDAQEGGSGEGEDEDGNGEDNAQDDGSGDGEDEGGNGDEDAQDSGSGEDGDGNGSEDDVQDGGSDEGEGGNDAEGE